MEAPRTKPAIGDQVPPKYPPSTPQVRDLVLHGDGDWTRAEMLQRLGLSDRKNLASEDLRPALGDGLIEITIPDKPHSSKQRYRLTAKGRES